MEWMINTQLGRRNLPPQQRIAVVKKFEKKIQEQADLKKEESNKTFYGNRFTGKIESSPNGEQSKNKIHTDKELAKMAGVGTGTIARFNRVMNSDNEDLKKKMESGELTINAAYEKIRKGEKYMKSCKTKFLEKSILGRETNLDDPEEVILKCIKLAYRDMLTAGRYYITNDMDLRCENFKSILENNHYVYSREIIEETLLLFGMKEKIGNGNKYVTAYGLAQKLVNMTYKYLYIFSAYIDKNIDFSNCDCPLDSIILGKLQYNGHVWSKMTKDEYIYCQQMITDCLQQENLDDELAIIGNLAFDFLNW